MPDVATTNPNQQTDIATTDGPPHHCRAELRQDVCAGRAHSGAPQSHMVRSYYPNFLIVDQNDRYIIVEVKADYHVDASVVRAKQSFAE